MSYCFPFLTSNGYRFGLNQHIGESYTNWICLIHMELKENQRLTKTKYFISSVYRFFLAFYLDNYSYSVHSRTYQWIRICGVSTEGRVALTIFPWKSLPALTVPWCVVYFWRWPPLRQPFLRAFQEPKMLPLDRFPEGN